MQAYVASKAWKDGFGAGETRITASDLIRIENGISAATQGVTNTETKVAELQTTAKALDGKITAAQKEVGDVLTKAVPIGAILIWPTIAPPNGWLICNGSTLNRTGYPDLFKVIGTKYGEPSSSTFSLPNLSQRVPVGVGGTFQLGGQGGEITHTLTTSEMPSHAHGVGGNIVNRADGSSPFRELAAGAAGGSNSTSAYAGGSQPHNNLQPYLVLNYIIKAAQ